MKTIIVIAWMFCITAVCAETCQIDGSFMYSTGETKVEWGKILTLYRCIHGHTFWVVSNSVLQSPNVGGSSGSTYADILNAVTNSARLTEEVYDQAYKRSMEEQRLARAEQLQQQERAMQWQLAIDERKRHQTPKEQQKDLEEQQAFNEQQKLQVLAARQRQQAIEEQWEQQTLVVRQRQQVLETSPIAKTATAGTSPSRTAIGKAQKITGFMGYLFGDKIDKELASGNIVKVKKNHDGEIFFQVKEKAQFRDFSNVSIYVTPTTRRVKKIIVSKDCSSESAANNEVLDVLRELVNKFGKPDEDMKEFKDVSGINYEYACGGVWVRVFSCNFLGLRKSDIHTVSIVIGSSDL